jgi:N-acetylglucosaminyl-diphospho-decaprenol L-rhamnosyltransferase
MSRLAVVIVSFNTCVITRRCLQALAASTGVAPLVVVVDNGSTDGSATLIAAEFPTVRLLQNTTNCGFAAATNQGLRLALSEAYDDMLLLNSDAFVEPGALATMLAELHAHPTVGVVAPQLRNQDGSLQPSGRPFPTLASKLADLSGWSRRGGRNNYLVAGRDYALAALVEDAPAACLLVRRRVIEQVGELDEGFRFNYEDTDWCRRIAAAGWTILYLPAARVTHLWGASQTSTRDWVALESRRGLLRYFRKHGQPAEVLALRVALLALDLAVVLRYCLRGLLRPTARPQLYATLAIRLRALAALVGGAA